ncbi:TPA: hypothetical protein UMY98_000332 [Stenotrophomonas maltophilia]|nr:hypothetical protein [Stenotrophomonas maltophilia]
MYNLILQASFRDDFSIEQVTVELGGVIDRLWPDYERAANAAGIDRQHLHTELVLGGWEPRRGSMIATAFAKSNSAIPAIVQPLDGGLASPGEPLRGWQDSFDLEAVLSAGKIQAWWLSGSVGRKVAGGRLLATVVREGYTVVHDLGDL